MAKTTFKLPVSVAKFPFRSAMASLGVMDPGPDVSARTPLSLYGGTESVDYNTIGPVFVENMWPVDSGLVSVGYDEVRSATSPGLQLDRAFVVRDGTTNFAVVAISYTTGVYSVYRSSYGGWLGKGATATGRAVTHAYVDGRNFFWAAGTDLREWLFAGDAFAGLLPVWPAGVLSGSILGICSAGNYMIAFTEELIMWSSLANPINFSDTAGGAGNQIPNQLRGPIRTVVPAPDGFIIYTTVNAVAAQATNDASRPWIFREIRDAGGVESIEQVTADTPAAQQYTIGPFGIQQVTMQRAETVFPDAADFLVSRHIELWNEANETVDLLTTNLNTLPRVTFLAGRYLFISYGFINGNYSAALIHDTALNRWGKVRIPHLDIVQIPGQTLWGLLTPTFSAAGPGNQLQLRENITFVHSNGGLKRMVLFNGQSQLVWATEWRDIFQGVVILGRVQSRRGKQSTLHEVMLHRTGERMLGSDVRLIKVMCAEPASNSGQLYINKQTLTGFGYTGAYQSWRGRYTYEYFDVILVGAMEMATLTLTVQQHGSR